MILEVNNTFGERRMYLLNGSSSSSVQSEDRVETNTTTSRTFRDTWTKDFHVSPFNSRKGSYAMTAHDPFSPRLRNHIGTIDNNVTLKSSKAHAKLVARVFSTEPGVDPATLTSWARLRFIAAWWWVGFVTFPRIIKEAGKLFFRRKLHVWYRPEVLKDSIGRQATMEETLVFLSFCLVVPLNHRTNSSSTSIIERSFRPYLKSLVEYCSLSAASSARSLRYISPIPNPSISAEGETFTPKTSTSTADPEKDEPIVFKPTTPLFYSRLVRHSRISEFLSSELLRCDDRDRTFWVSHPQLLLKIFEQSRNTSVSALSVEEDDNGKERSPSILERYGWRLLHSLRNYHTNPLSVYSSSTTNNNNNEKKSDIRAFTLSPLDHYTKHHLPSSQSSQYRSTVTKILLSDVVAFGYPEVVDAVAYLGKVGVSWGVVWGVHAFLG